MPPPSLKIGSISFPALHSGRRLALLQPPADNLWRTVVAWMLAPSREWTDMTHTPRLNGELTWSFDCHRHLMRVATHVNRDRAFADLFRKIAGAVDSSGLSR